MIARGNAADVKAKYIVEAANNPTDPEADEVECLQHYSRVTGNYEKVTLHAMF